MNILLPLAWLYGILIWIRNRCYDLGFFKCYRLPGKVISVGNIAVGGTGKSPVVMSIARDILGSRGSPAIVTRGYRSGLQRKEWQVLLNGEVIAGTKRRDVVADEAIMQSLALPNVPVVVGAKRFDAVQRFLSIKHGFVVTHWILDDGFQHRRIARDMDIVLLDARAPVGALMPAGRFREPVSALRRADWVIMTKAESIEQSALARQLVTMAKVKCQISEVKFLVNEPRLVSGSSSHVPRRWGLVAGISQPMDFERAVTSQNLTVSERLYVGDHAKIPEKALIDLVSKCDAILTTEKDFARARSSFNEVKIPTFVLGLTVDWAGLKPEF